MNKLSVLTGALFILLGVTSVIPTSQAQEYTARSETGVMVGISRKNITFIIQEQDDDTEKARFEDDQTAPMLVVTTPDFMFNSWTSWGLAVEFGYTDFEVTTQLDSGDNKRSFGTKVDGNYTYAMAMFTLQSDDKHADRGDEHGFILGLGIGLAQLKASGDVVYTGVGTSLSRHQIDTNEIGLIMGLYGEYRVEGFYVRLNIYATSGNESSSNDPATADNTYVVGDSAVSVGYSVYF